MLNFHETTHHRQFSLATCCAHANSVPYSIGWFMPTHCMLYACFRDLIYDATAPNFIGRFHAHSLYALCMFQGSYLWRNCPEFHWSVSRPLYLYACSGILSDATVRISLIGFTPLLCGWPPPYLFGYAFQNKGQLRVLWPCSKYWDRMYFSKHLLLSFGDLFSDGKYYRLHHLFFGGGLDCYITQWDIRYYTTYIIHNIKVHWRSPPTWSLIKKKFKKNRITDIKN